MNVDSITAQDLLELAEFIYLGIDTSEKVNLINRKGCEIFGYKESEMIGMNYFDNFLPSEIVKDMKKVFSKRIKDRKTTKTTHVNPILTKTGEEKIIGWQSTLLTDENGVIISLLHAGIDLTETRKLEEELKESEAAQEKIKSSEALYRAIFENTGSGVMLIKGDDTISLINRRLLEMTGYVNDEVISAKWSEFIPATETERVKETITLWEEREAPILTLETVYLNKSKEERNILISIGRIPDSTQKAISLLDITIEKKLEKIMIESEERMRSLVENVPIAIAIMSADGVILEVNQAYWNLLGYDSKNELFKTKPSDHWINLRDRERLYTLLEKKKNINNFETKLRKRDGTSFWGSISAISHRDISGDLVSYQIVQDISSQKEIENELRQQLMKYKLEEANLYMVEEEFAYTSTEIFDDLLKVGYEGTIFSRTLESKWKKDITRRFTYYKLAEKGKGRTIPPNLEKLEAIMEELPSRQIILLDRLDYLIQKNSFESTLFFIYRLMDIAFLANHIILLSIDTSILNAQEKNLICKELKHIEQKEENLIPEDLFEVLMMVYQKNVSGAKPTISNIIDELRISRPTARKRIQGLIDNGYVTETTKGRSKVLQITLKGKSMF